MRPIYFPVCLLSVYCVFRRPRFRSDRYETWYSLLRQCHDDPKSRKLLGRFEQSVLLNGKLKNCKLKFFNTLIVNRAVKLNGDTS